MSLKLSQKLLQTNWNTLKLDIKEYLFKHVVEGNKDAYEMLFFDLCDFKLFNLKHNSKDIQALFKKLNPSLEAPSSKIVETIGNNLTNNQLANEIFHVDHDHTDGLKIKMQSKLAGVKIAWEFEFVQLENRLIKDYVVLPMVFNCAEYQFRENELVKMIQAKDKEIDDYKSQGTKLSRKFLATEVFSAESFDEFIDKKYPPSDVIESPHRSLNTALSYKINGICYNKYIKNNVKFNEVMEREEEVVSQSEVGSSQSGSNGAEEQTSNDEKAASQNARKEEISQSPRLSQQEIRLKELELKLQKEKEDAEKAKKGIAKKKKLF